MTIDIEGLQERIAGLVGQMSFDQAVDAIHRELRTAGVGEGDALAVNAAILDLLKPTLPRFSTFELFVTRWCNLDCAYCFVHSKEPLAHA